jgi:hypothetical protein
LHPQLTFYFVGEISEQAALAVGNNTLRLIHPTKQKPKADMDCISRGKREKGRFVAKGKPNFLAAKYFPTRHLGGGGGRF